MKPLLKIILVLIFLAQSCSVGDKQFKDVLNSPETFHDKEIEITGVFHEQFEDFAIYLTNDSDRDEALWVDFSEIFMSLNSFTGLDGQQVRLKGIFNKNEKGHLGAYAGTIKEAVLVD